MKPGIRASAAAVIAAAACGAGAAEALESRIDAVTVYPRGAEVTRIVSVTLKKGSNQVALEGFPADIDVRRLSAVARSDEVQVRSVHIDVLEQRDAYNAEVRRLQEAIVEAQDGIAAINDEIAAAELQLKFLEGLAEGYAADQRSDAVSGQANIASWKEAITMIGESAAGALENARKARSARREAETDLSVLERELENKRGGAAASTRLLVSLAADSALQTNLRVRYFQPQAGWGSGYAAYLDTGRSALTLTHEAQVRQNTHEDWPNVQLTLSTADPGSRMQAPDQGSQFLDLYDPRMQRRDVRRMEMESGFAAQVSAGVFEEKIATARIKAGRSAVRYRAAERADVSNDADQSQTVPLAEYGAKVSLVSTTTPRQNAQAYLTARFTHDSDTPLLAGSMRVFVDGGYAGMAEFPELLPGTEAVLPMGPDRQIEVLVTDQGGEKGREGLLSARNTELTDYLFEIVNRHSQATEVEVIDYYPVPRNERIEVSVPRGATAPDQKDLKDRPGVAAWRKELAPGERWRIVHQYEISYPKDASLSESP